MLLRAKSPHARLDFQASAQNMKARTHAYFFVYGSEVGRLIK